MMIDEMCKPVINNSPNSLRLKRTVLMLANKNILKPKKIKLLSQKGKKIESIKTVIDTLKKKIILLIMTQVNFSLPVLVSIKIYYVDLLILIEVKR